MATALLSKQFMFLAWSGIVSHAKPCNHVGVLPNVPDQIEETGDQTKGELI